MRRVQLAVVFAVLSLSSFAMAQDPKGNPASKDYRQFQLRREDRVGSAGDAGRARARAGDCKGALGSFDAAARGSIDPSVRRDRGLCHEKLGNAFPAMEDFRFYLNAQPDAPDADQIRERLVRLEEETGVAARGSNNANASSSNDTGSRNGSRAGDAEPDNNRSDRFNYDKFVEERRRQSVAETSPLRFGTGAILLPRYMFRHLSPGDGFTISDPYSHSLGLAIKFPVSRALVPFVDFSYSQVGKGVTSVGGPGGFFGFEIRLPIAPSADITPFINLAAGYEDFSGGARQAKLGYLQGRGQVGLRFALGSSLAIELGGNLAYGQVFIRDAPTSVSANGVVFALPDQFSLLAVGVNAGVGLAF
jgi:hypothetical protein